MESSLLFYKNQSFYKFFIAIISLVCCFSVFASDTQLKQHPKVFPGLEYEHRRVIDIPWSIHILKVDRIKSGLEIITTLGNNATFGLATLSSHIASMPSRVGEPIAGINGDFYTAQVGDPLGIQILNKELISAPSGESFWIDLEGNLHLDKVISDLRVVWPKGNTTNAGLNRERKDNDLVLYTPRIGNTTSNIGGREIVLKFNDKSQLPLQVGKRYIGIVSRINEKGNTKIQPDNFVLSLSGNMMNESGMIRLGDKIQIVVETRPNLNKAKTAIGGGPFLINNGKPGSWIESTRHPRTAIGWNKKFFFMVVVDGRQPGLSVGMTLPELAKLMEQLGCTEAMNLDGGGSSTFWFGGMVLNSCSDGRERKIANALILVNKKE